METDVELGPTSKASARLEGYPKFAEFIAKDKDAAIYRRFQYLSARSLLYQQSEIHDVEEQLEKLDYEDAKDIGNVNAQSAARQWHSYASNTDAHSVRRRELQSKIETKIKKYHKALILESQVLSLNSPSSHTLKEFKRWYTLDSTFVLWGRDEQLFDKNDDLATLAPADMDRLNMFLKQHFGWLLEKKSGNPQPKGMVYFPERRVQRAGAVVSVILSAVLLIGAIVCLLKVADQGAGIRVGMIVLFTCLFAGVVGLLTNARRAEIFGSTAAYAAVLVVFVSNNIGNSSTKSG